MLVPDALAETPEGRRARIVVPDPYAALVRVMAALFPPAALQPGVDPAARLGPGCVLGADVSIGPFVVLGRGVHLGARSRLAEGVSLGDGVTIGEDTVIGPRAVCYAETRIGSRVVIKAGAVIGGPGFGYSPNNGTINFSFISGDFNFRFVIVFDTIGYQILKNLTQCDFFRDQRYIRISFEYKFNRLFRAECIA